MNTFNCLNDFLTTSDVVLELLHESSIEQFTKAYLNGLRFGFWPSDNGGENIFPVTFEEGAVGNSKWCFVNGLQIRIPAIFLSVIFIPIKITWA